MESHDDVVLIFVTSKQEEVTKKLRSVSLCSQNCMRPLFFPEPSFLSSLQTLFSGHGNEW